METIIYAVIGTVVGALILTFILKVIVPRLKDLLYRNKLARCLIQSVRNAFQGLNNWPDEEINSSTYWTTQLFSELDRLAEELDVDVRHNPKGNPDWGEFLWDVCFLVTAGRHPQGNFAPKHPLKKVLLVLECEWERNTEKILFDFTKLLTARAELRVFVFCVDNERFEPILDAIKAAINAFTRVAKSDRYLICNVSHPLQFQFVLLDGRGKERYRI